MNLFLLGILLVLNNVFCASLPIPTVVDKERELDDAAHKKLEERRMERMQEIKKYHENNGHDAKVLRGIYNENAAREKVDSPQSSDFGARRERALENLKKINTMKEENAELLAGERHNRQVLGRNLKDKHIVKRRWAKNGKMRVRLR